MRRATSAASPGYNFSVANTDRPLDAAAAAALATCGVFAPLLLTDRADLSLKPLEDYLLSVSQPGYEDDLPGGLQPGSILGDDEAVSVESQAQLDAITELAPAGNRTSGRWC